MTHEIPHLIRQREWSGKTFGEHGDRTLGLIRHIQKELEEIAAALDRKQKINMARAWPDISSANLAEPIEHLEG